MRSEFRGSGYKNKDGWDIRRGHRLCLGRLLPVSDHSDQHLRKKPQKGRGRVDLEAHRRKQTNLLSMRRGRDLAMPEPGFI
jgi:hypothetical protein